MDTARLIDALSNRHDCPHMLELVDHEEFGCGFAENGYCRVERACEAKYPDSVPDYEQHARTLMHDCWRKWFGEDTERLRELVSDVGHLEFEQRDGGQVAYRAGLGADWSEPMTWERMMETITTEGGDASCQEPS